MKQKYLTIGLVVWIILGCDSMANACYESHRWTIGEIPHRVGLIEVNGVETIVSFGDEYKRSFRVRAPIYAVASATCLPLVAAVVAYATVKHRRNRLRNA